LAKSLQFPEAPRESKPSKEQFEHAARFVDRVGQRRQSLGNTDGAIAEYREALRLNPDYALAHYNLGLALRYKGDLDGAIAEFRNATRLQPDYAPAHYGLGLALRYKGDLDGAIAEFRTAIRLQRDYAPAHHGLGGALEMKGDHSAALDEIEIARELEPNDSSITETYERIRRKASRHG